MHLHYKVNRKPTRNERERKLCIHSIRVALHTISCHRLPIAPSRIPTIHGKFMACIQTIYLQPASGAHSSRDIYWLRSRTTAKKNSNSLPILKTIDSSIVWQARDSITHLPCPFHNEWMNSRWLECLIFRKKNKYGIESESCSSQPRPQPNGSVCGKCIFRLYKEWREANEHQLIGFEGIRRMAQNRFNDGLNLIFSFMIWRHVNTSCHNTHQQHTRTHTCDWCVFAWRWCSCGQFSLQRHRCMHHHRLVCPRRICALCSKQIKT